MKQRVVQTYEHQLFMWLQTELAWKILVGFRIFDFILQWSLYVNDYLISVTTDCCTVA